MPVPKNTLIITRINEISFVDKGDNPPAGVTILKAAPISQTGASMANEATPTADELAKRDAAFAKLQADFEKQQETLAKMQEEAAIAVIAKGLPQGVDVSLAADLRTVQKASPDAYARINAVIEGLAKRANAVGALTARIGSVGKTATGSEGIEKAIAPLMASGMTREAAIVKALESNPDLYEVR
jgi:hypothetical protein